jgi:hypothetical protein
MRAPALAGLNWWAGGGGREVRGGGGARILRRYPPLGGEGGGGPTPPLWLRLYSPVPVPHIIFNCLILIHTQKSTCYLSPCLL